MADLKTTYKDDLLDTSVNEKRKYNMIQNADGTVSFEDVTTYSQIGDSFGAADINATNKKVNEVNSNLTASDELKFRFATDGEGNYGYLGADDSFIPFKGNVSIKVRAVTWLVSGGRVIQLNLYVNDELVQENLSSTFSNSGNYDFYTDTYNV